MTKIVTKKKCTKCGKSKILSAFHFTIGGRKVKTKYRRGDCKVCQHKLGNEKRNPLIRRKIELKFRHGITVEKFDLMLKKQLGKCKICGDVNKAKGKNNLCVDHDHKTGKIRGLLCHNCNVGLGYFKDNIDVLKNSIKYLRANNE